MRVSRSFAPVAEAVGQSRRFATETLVGAPPDTRSSVELMVSELATNALLHADSGYTMTIDYTPATIRVEVHDEGGGSLIMRSPGSSDPHGRGLHIVKELSDDWGTTEAGRFGKVVWFEVEVREHSHAVGSAFAEHGTPDIPPGAHQRTTSEPAPNSSLSRGGQEPQLLDQRLRSIRLGRVLAPSG